MCWSGRRPTGTGVAAPSSPGVSLTRRRRGWHWGSNGRILNNLAVLAVAQLVSGASHYCGRRRQWDGLPTWAKRTRSELHHGIRHRLHLPSADSPVWPRPRSRVPATTTRRTGRWGELSAGSGLPLTILGRWAFHLNAAISTNPPPRSPDSLHSDRHDATDWHGLPGGPGARSRPGLSRSVALQPGRV